MTTRVLVIGGYGNFGRFIAQRLAREPSLTVVIAGRSAEKAQAAAATLRTGWAVIDIASTLEQALADIKPDIVIHTSGPFQGQDYAVAEACIRYGAHYIDLADGRAFVSAIGRLNSAAKTKGVLVVSGASSVPGLTSAIIDQHEREFARLELIDYGIATAHKINRGLATAKAVLSYAGKPFTTLIDGRMRSVHGWQGLHWRRLPELGWRPMGYCDVPDLELFPDRYKSLKTIRFSAGLEMPFVHLTLWALTWLVRIGAIPDLGRAAPVLLFLSRWVDPMGTDVSGFYMLMEGTDAAGSRRRIDFNLIARSGHGLVIPCVPAIVAALGLARGQIVQRGAMPCVGLLPLDALLDELKPFDISWTTERSAIVAR